MAEFGSCRYGLNKFDLFEYWPHGEKNIRLIKSSTAGTRGNYASGDRVRLVNKTAVVGEGIIHVL
ncbi:MAG: hypothetical protein ACTSUE_07225 [Promethearchaeota archaeon]